MDVNYAIFLLFKSFGGFLQMFYGEGNDLT